MQFFGSKVYSHPYIPSYLSHRWRRLRHTTLCSTMFLRAVLAAAATTLLNGVVSHSPLLLVFNSWFKKDFFKWTNKPPCSACGARGGNMQGKGGCSPTPEEASAKASRVELYGCKDCGAETRFPRYNDPAKLLETRNVRAVICSSAEDPSPSGPKTENCLFVELVNSFNPTPRLFFPVPGMQVRVGFLGCSPASACLHGCSWSVFASPVIVCGLCRALFNLFSRCTMPARRGGAASLPTASRCCAGQSAWRRGARWTGRTTSGRRSVPMASRCTSPSQRMVVR